MSLNNYYFIEIQFLGYRFHGWQKQPNIKTVHLMIDRTINYVLGENKFKTLGTGRTDAMVSANQTAFELFIEKPLIDQQLFLELVNTNLPQDIRALSIKTVNKEFNIINHPKLKEYKYLFSEGTKNHPYSAPFITTFLDSLDIDLMKEGAKLFEGLHNFKSYCYKPNDNGIFEREINYCRISNNDTLKANFFPEKSYELTVRGKGFMRNQIRLMMGVLVELGRAEVNLDYIRDSLTKYNPEINYIAPASGLMLNKVDFKF
ncbi:tRNA pseudouridine(38-40) synthase TruA [Flavobacteriaceae bacterium]|nr:tRNA pseudouridine(38-40) synthase TruA [Flavobacteriaceae bacterium]